MVFKQKADLKGAAQRPDLQMDNLMDFNAGFRQLNGKKFTKEDRRNLKEIQEMD